MKKALFNEIFGLMKELGINLQLGTRTNVQRHPSVRHFGKNLVSKELIREHVEQGSVDKVLKVFEGEGAYIPQFDDYQGKTFLKNLNRLKTVLNPPPPQPSNVIDYMDPGGLGSLKIKKHIGEGHKIWKALGLDSTSNKDARKYIAINDEMKKLDLDIDKMSDVEKYLGKETTQGIGSMFKKTDDPGSVVPGRKTTDEIIKGIDQELTPNLIDEPPVSVTEQMDNLVDESKTLMDEAQKLKDLAFKMSPQYEAQQQAKNKLRYSKLNEGKGYEGGAMGGKEGYFRAVVRPFLIREHEQGRIKLSDSVYKSLQESSDLSSGGFMDQMYPDPIRVFRHHYGDNAFDLIPADIQSPAKSDILQAFDTNVNTFKPIEFQGPRNTGGYQTVGEYRAKLADLNDTIKVIKEGGGRFDAMTQDEKLKEIAQVNIRKETLKKTFKNDYPNEIIGDETFDELWGMNPEDFSEGGRVGLRVGGAGGAFKKFVERLFMKASNDIRLGRGIWKGLDTEQKVTQHDNLTKIVDKFMKTGEFDPRANEYFGIDAEEAFRAATRPKTINISDDAVAQDFTDFIKKSDPEGYKKLEQKIELSHFDPKGRKPNATGGGIGSMFKERAGYAPGGRVLAKGATWFLRSLKKNLQDMLLRDPRFTKITTEERDIISQQMTQLIKDLEAGGEVPVEALQAIKDNPQYYRSSRVTRTQDPDMAEVEELIVEKLGGDEVSEVLANFDITTRKPNATGGGVGSMFRRV